MQCLPKAIAVITSRGTPLTKKAPSAEMHKKRTLYVAYHVIKVKVLRVCILVYTRIGHAHTNDHMIVYNSCLPRAQPVLVYFVRLLFLATGSHFRALQARAQTII